MVHKYHSSVNLRLKTFEFEYTMLTICNDIVSNVWNLAMSHCGRNVAYTCVLHIILISIDIFHTTVHLIVMPEYIRWSNKAWLYNYDLVDTRKGKTYIDNYYAAMSEFMTQCV